MKEQSERFGLGSFELKCKFGGKTENYSVVTTEQWQLELPSLFGDEHTPSKMCLLKQNFKHYAIIKKNKVWE